MIHLKIIREKGTRIKVMLFQFRKHDEETIFIRWSPGVEIARAQGLFICINHCKALGMETVPEGTWKVAL